MISTFPFKPIGPIEPASAPVISISSSGCPGLKFAPNKDCNLVSFTSSSPQTSARRYLSFSFSVLAGKTKTRDFAKCDLSDIFKNPASSSIDLIFGV